MGARYDVGRYTQQPESPAAARSRISSMPTPRGGGRIRTSVPYTDSIFRHRPGHGDGKPARQPEPVLTICKRRFTVRRARLAPAMISTPGHRSSIYVTSRSFGTHYTLGSDTTIENAAHWRPGRFRVRSSRGGRPYLPIAGDRGFESFSLHRRVRCEPDFRLPFVTGTDPLLPTEVFAPISSEFNKAPIETWRLRLSFGNIPPSRSHLSCWPRSPRSRAPATPLQPPIGGGV